MKVQNNIFHTSYRALSYKKAVQKSSNNIFEFSKNASDAIRNNSIAHINFTRKIPSTVEEICAKLKNEYEIDAEFENIDVARMTLEAIEDFVKLNDKDMFKGLIIKNGETSSWRTRSNYNTNYFVICLNNETSKEEIEQKAKEDYDNCEIASDNPKYRFYEPLSEFLCFKYNPYAYNRNSKKDNYSDAFLKVARKLCNCATTNFAHFNSTYIAAKMCGVELPKDAEKFYIELLGPELNFKKTEHKIKPQDEIKHFESIEQAQEYLKQYGIEARFSDLHRADITVSAIEDFIKLNNNPQMFNGLTIGTCIDDIFVPAETSWSYDSQEDKIVSCEMNLNLAYDWKRHEKIMQKNCSSGHYASDNPKYNLYHELAHWLHFHDNPSGYAEQYNQFKNGSKYVNNYGKKIFGKVSGYATDNPLEFVGEYIAAKMCGEKFPKVVDDSFKLHCGLELKFPD